MDIVSWEGDNDNQPISFSNFTTQNSSFLIQSPWNFTAVFTLICSVLAFTLNSFVATVLLFHATLRSPFTVYIVALLIFDALLGIHGWLNTIRAIFPKSMANVALCDFRSYVSWVITAIPLNLHVLIGINRIWAVGFPLAYRNRHNSKVAIALTFATIVYVHCTCLPGVVLDAVYYRLPFDRFGCLVNTNAMIDWYRFVSFLIFEFPIIFMIVSWICIAFKQRQRQMSLKSSATVSNAKPVYSRTNSHSTTGFRVFSVLTVSAVLCWAPYQTYGTMMAFDPLMPVDERILTFFLAVYLVQPVLHPVLLVLNMQDLRSVLTRMITSLMCKS